jgi:hypothetical protein
MQRVDDQQCAQQQGDHAAREQREQQLLGCHGQGVVELA